MEEEGLQDVTNQNQEEYIRTTSRRRANHAMAEVRKNTQSLRQTLESMRDGLGLMRTQIAERKRFREESAAALSSDKHARGDDSADEQTHSYSK